MEQPRIVAVCPGHGSPVVLMFPTVLAPSARPILAGVAAVPAVLTIPALPVVLVVLVVPGASIVPKIGTAATAQASAMTAAVSGGTVGQHRRGHPPDGMEEAEAEQNGEEDEKQDEHGGPPRERDTASIPGTGASPHSLVLPSGCGYGVTLVRPARHGWLLDTCRETARRASVRRAAPAPGSVAPPTRSPEGAPRASCRDPPRHEQSRSRTRLVTRSRRSPDAPHAGNDLPPAASWEDHILPSPRRPSRPNPPPRLHSPRRSSRNSPMSTPR